MKNKTTQTTILIFALILLNLIPFVSAQAIIGVSPGNLDYKNVLRGGYAEKILTITLDTENPVGISLEPRGETTEWLNFSEKNFTINRDNPGKIIISVNPPIDTPNGNYTGFLRVKTKSIGEPGKKGHATGNVIAVIDATINVEITDIEVKECKARNFKVFSTEKGDNILFQTDILNTGNIRLKPSIKAKIWDQEQIALIKEVNFQGNDILPTKEKTINFEVPTNDIGLGQYWTEIEVEDCFTSETLTFDILEPGALKAIGVLINIISKVWTEVGETIPIIANFKNIGEKNVNAKFKGQITKDGKIVQILETQEAIVPINELTNFTLFFTPQKPGKYIASGRVFYDKKRTFESSAVINVNPKKFGSDQIKTILIYLIMIALTGFLILKIKKERKKFRK